MAVEAGATSGICNPDMKTVEYIWNSITRDFPSKEAAFKSYRRFASDPTRGTNALSPWMPEPSCPCHLGYKPDQVKPLSAFPKHG
jgi:3-isopropylmalate/(R)-2-methylmalate dehydratase large subunit